MFTTSFRSVLATGKKNTNDASWQALKARTDPLATYSIHPYKFARSADAPAGTICRRASFHTIFVSIPPSRRKALSRSERPAPKPACMLSF